MTLQALEPILAEVADGKSGLASFLPRIAQTLGCQWATLWLTDGMVLRAVAVWADPSVDSAGLAQRTEGRSLSPGEGNAGLVWRSRKTLWTDDLSSEMCLPRSIEARGAGMAKGVWFAIQTEQKVYGVVELLGRKVLRPPEQTVEAVDRLGRELGLLLARL